MGQPVTVNSLHREFEFTTAGSFLLDELSLICVADLERTADDIVRQRKTPSAP
jgi:hypothetical protein